MKVDTTFVVPSAAVVSSVLLLIAGKQRIFEILALAASAVWLLLELNVFDWPLHHKFAQPGLVLGGLLVLSGVVVYLKTDDKREITASTVLTILGGILVVGALGAL